MIHTYLVDAEVPFLCGKQTLESWNFKIDGREKILDIQLISDQDCSKKLIKMVTLVRNLRMDPSICFLHCFSRMLLQVEIG